MLNLLKATHYKLLTAHADISSGSQPSSEFAEFIVTSKDKQVCVAMRDYTKLIALCST